MAERNRLLQAGTGEARHLLAWAEGIRQLKTETEAAWQLAVRKRELSSFRLRNTYEYDAGGQTLLQDPGDERTRQIQAETEEAPRLQADLEGGR